VGRAYAGIYRESLLDRLRSELSGDFRVRTHKHEAFLSFFSERVIAL
jgi:hypothetical protein